MVPDESRGRRGRLHLHARTGRRNREAAAPVHVDELVLTDPAEERLSLVTGISQSIFAKYGTPGMSCPPLILIGPCQMPRSFCSS